MRLRHEQKFFLSTYTATVLRKRLSLIMRPDAHAGPDGKYVVNNLYLDDIHNSSYNEKIRGFHDRNKYRIRFYNGDLSTLRFENKHKQGELSHKRSVKMSVDEYHSLKNGDFNFTLDSDEPLWQMLATLHRTRRMRPTAAFSYTREAYVYAPGNVRITFDTNIRQDHMRADLETVAPPGSGGLLEVKFDSFLPSIIKDMLCGVSLTRTEMSKYCYSFERGLLHVTMVGC